jgi:cysteine desulfurase
VTVYLDSAATTPVRREVLEAMWPYFAGEFGNPSSSHDMGDRAASALADARARVAGILGCRASEIIFTSGGTESDNLAIKGMALGNPRGRHLVVSSIEHQAVLESCDYLARLHGFEVSVVGVDGDGMLRLDDLAAALRPDTTLASVMYANNEVGTVQPLARVAELVHGVGAVLHTDAVQAAGWLDLTLGGLGVDALSISGHKLGAPKGVGALYVRGRVPVEPLVHGGGQERGRRSGTENIAGAVGLAVALELAEAERLARGSSASEARDEFIAAVLAGVPEATLSGHPVERLPSNASFTFEGTSGEAVLLELERRGILSSSGSACAAGSDAPSHVLVAMGVDPVVAQTAVRFSFAHETTREQLREVAEALPDAVAAVRGIR